MNLKNLNDGVIIKVTETIPAVIHFMDDGRETAEKEINVCRGAVIILLAKSDSIAGDSYGIFAINGFSSHQLRLKIKFKDLEDIFD